MLPRWRGSLRRQATEVGTGLSVLRVELQGMEEIGARGGRMARAGFEDAEIIPAVGVVGLEVQRLALLVDGLRKLSAGIEELGNEGVDFGAVGRAEGGLA